MSMPNLVASTTWSRRPPSTSPSRISLPPALPYTSAVSKNVTPASSAASTTARVPSRSTRRPKLLQPRPTTDTLSPPSSRCGTSAMRAHSSSRLLGGHERLGERGAPRGAPAAVLRAVRAAEDAHDRRGRQGAQRLGLPAPGPVSHPRQGDQLGIAAQDEIGERASRDVRWHHAVTHVPPGEAEAGGAIEADAQIGRASCRERV